MPYTHTHAHRVLGDSQDVHLFLDDLPALWGWQRRQPDRAVRLRVVRFEAADHAGSCIPHWVHGRFLQFCAQFRRDQVCALSRSCHGRVAEWAYR